MNIHTRTKRKADKLRKHIRGQADDLNRLMADVMDSFHITRYTFRDIAKDRVTKGLRR